MARRKRITLYVGGLQGGKSVAGADALGEILYADRAALPLQCWDLTPEVWVLAPSYNLVKVARGYVEWRLREMVYTPEECAKEHLQRGDAQTIWLRPNQVDEKGNASGKPIRMMFRTSREPEDLRGAGNLLVAWWDEAAYGKEESWLVLLGRMIASGGKLLLTTTPRGKNWLYRDVYVPGTAPFGSPAYDDTIGVVRSRSAENNWADQRYLVQLRAKFGKEYASQELDAMFVAFEGYVYDFDPVKHVRRVPLVGDCDRVVAGVDPGFADPYAVVWMGRCRGVWYLLDEVYVTKRTTAELVPLVRAKNEKWGAIKFWCDVRRPTDIRDLRAAGFDAQAAFEPHGETDRRTIMPGIRLVQQLLDGGRLYSSMECEETNAEFQSYAFPDRESKNRGENPIDFKNHALDALRYALVSEEAVDHTKPAALYWDSRAQEMRARVARPVDVENFPSPEEMIARQDRAMDVAEARRRGSGVK